MALYAQLPGFSSGSFLARIVARRVRQLRLRLGSCAVSRAGDNAGHLASREERCSMNPAGDDAERSDEEE
jgi:hypothetical protein